MLLSRVEVSCSFSMCIVLLVGRSKGTQTRVQTACRASSLSAVSRTGLALQSKATIFTTIVDIRHRIRLRQKASSIVEEMASVICLESKGCPQGGQLLWTDQFSGCLLSNDFLVVFTC
ncbi:hypothetical protein I3843_05G147100 [Carya illinoinensis]|nr:hypothetical protein I3843_05G147100 [Carya illinoinensis]